MNWISRLWHWFWALRPWGQKPYRIKRVEDLPERVARNVVYVVGESTHYWAAAIVCPCGCGEIVHLNLLQGVRPRWTFEEHSDGRITLHPSVWRQKGCRSHFFVRKGAIIWCYDSSTGDSLSREDREAMAVSSTSAVESSSNRS